MKSYIKSQEQNIRNCYYEQPFYKSKSELLSSLYADHDKFVEMILYDAVFIIELFLRNYWKVEDFLLEKPCYRNTITRDLQLLENQLPYFILNKLYDLAIKGFGTYKGSSDKDPSFLHISCNFYGDHDLILRSLSSIDVKHFTDLRRYVLMQNHPTSKTQHRVVYLPCATKLHESGVRFGPDGYAENDDSLLALKYDNGNLQIPRIMVNDRTEVLVRNMMALEQCHYPKETQVCNYIAFMDFLVNTEQDVDLLIKNGIIVNCFGENKAIAKMFNDFCLQTSTSPSCYSDLAENLKKHYRRPYRSNYHQAKVILKRVYFSDPWKGTGTVAGIILLVLTAAQAIQSIMHFV